MNLLLIVLLAMALLLGFAFFRSRLQLLRLPPSDLIICAAHSDDCVIMGSELATVAVSAGYKIKLIFLTCSAASPQEEIAQRRANEARMAWSKLGVSPEDMVFLGLPQSPVEGPASYDCSDLVAATNRIKQTLDDVVEPTCVLVPAWGEDHIDHRSLREVALEAAAKTVKRDKLTVLETPEYNDLVSLTQDPIKAIVTMLKLVPGAGRIVGHVSRPAHFTGGSPAMIVDSSHGALETKMSMLQAFESQDPKLLTQYFGSRSRYRRVDPNRPTAAPRVFRFSGHRADISAVAFAIGLLGLAFSLGLALSERIPVLGWILSALTLAALTYAIHRKRRFFAALVISALFGAILGVA